MSIDTLAKAKAVFDQYVDERPFWVGLADWACEELRVAMQLSRLPTKVEGRAKTVGSAVGKVYRKPDSYGSLENFKDLTGTRVLVPFTDLVDDVVATVDRIEGWEIVEDDPKAPKPGELSYQARHLIVELGDSIGPERSTVGITRAVRFEVQVQTFAQSLWANSSHLVTYKKESLPDEILRQINRLVVLCELFDDRALSARDAALEAADHVDVISTDLQRLFNAITGQSMAGGEPLDIVPLLLPSNADDLDRYADDLDYFVTENWPDLVHILTTDVEARGQPLLTRPEILLIFERITNAQFAARQAWRQHLPESLFDELVAIWPSDNPPR